MPIDARIPLQIQPAQIDSPLQLAGQAMQLKNMAGQQQLQQGQQQVQVQQLEHGKFQLDQMKQQADEDEKIKAAITLNNGDLEKSAPLIIGIAGPRALPILKSITDRVTANLNQREAIIKLGAAQTGFIAQAMSGVKDEQSYQAALQQIQGAKIDTSHMAQNYNPAAVQQLQLAGVDAIKKHEMLLQDNADARAKAKAQHDAILAPLLEREAKAKAVTAEAEAAQGGKLTHTDVQIDVGGQPTPATKVTEPGGKFKIIGRDGKEISNAKIWKSNPVVNLNTGTEDNTLTDPNSQDILSQTGLSIGAFAFLTGKASSLPRDRATRAQAMMDAQKWAKKKGIDMSTMASQYKANNDVLASNISRMANTKIMENELQGTIQNLQGVVSDKDLGKVRFANVVDIWLGKEVNDPLAQQYALHLGQLHNELSAYYAATQGRTGNNITEGDQRDAARVIKDGISKGGLTGLSKAIENSTTKMGAVMQRSVDAANKSVWDLFGVGDKFKAKTQVAKPVGGEDLSKLSTDELMKRLTGK
jgi:hypothetical protein